MSDLFGNHIVGFPMRWLIFYLVDNGLFYTFKYVANEPLDYIVVNAPATLDIGFKSQSDRERDTREGNVIRPYISH